MKIINERVVPLAEVADLGVYEVNALYSMPGKKLTKSLSKRKPVRRPDSISQQEMADSINEVGQLAAIILYTPPGSDQTLILDGKIRRAACVLAGVETVCVADFEGSEEEAHEYLVAVNIDRRFLTSDQRAVIGGMYRELRPGHFTRTGLARLFLTPVHLVERACGLLEEVADLEIEATKADLAARQQRFGLEWRRLALEKVRAAGDQARIAEVAADLNTAAEAAASAEELAQALASQAAKQRKWLLQVRDGQAKLV